MLVALGGELAVPCHPQSATAGLNSHRRPAAWGVGPATRLPLRASGSRVGARPFPAPAGLPTTQRSPDRSLSGAVGRRQVLPHRGPVAGEFLQDDAQATEPQVQFIVIPPVANAGHEI